MAIIYHITSETWWKIWEKHTIYVSPTFNQEKFIHLSTAAQVAGVLERYYTNQTNLIKLSVDTDKLTAELKYEKATNNELFPHLYGAINKDAIIAIEKIN